MITVSENSFPDDNICWVRTRCQLGKHVEYHSAMVGKNV